MMFHVSILSLNNLHQTVRFWWGRAGVAPRAVSPLSAKMRLPLLRLPLLAYPGRWRLALRFGNSSALSRPGEDY